MPRPRRPGPWLGVRAGVYNIFWYNKEIGRTERKSLRTQDAKVAEERFRLHSDRLSRAPVPQPVTLVDRHKLISRLFNRAKTNAKERKHGFTLTREFAVQMLEDQRYCCAVSGVPFSFTSAPRDPWQPSIDRIDCTRGYHPDNVRMVCLIANVAMNRWGEGVLRDLARHMATNANIVPLSLD